MTTPAQTPGAPALVFNPLDPAFRADPYALYRRLLAEAPVSASPLGGMVFTRHADCVAILGDERFSNDARNADVYATLLEQRGGLTPEEQAMEAKRPFLFMDPPDHTRLRGLVNKAFTPRVVERLRPRIEELVDELIDRVAPAGSLDVVEDLAYLLPVTIISEMLGVPTEDHPTFRQWSRELARSLDPEIVLPPDVLERRQRAVFSFHEYFADLIDERRADPKGDLLSALIAAEDGGSTLSKDELLSICTLLLVAGHETTVNLIGNGMLALLRHPDQMDLLRDDLSLIRSAVEELLRFDPPVQMTLRIAAADVEVGGATVRKGQEAILLLAAANRDPAEFADPERLDITRQENRHIAFGYGIHFCLGAPLARVEGQIAIGALVRRLKSPRLLTDAPVYKENIVLRGLAELPVGFEGVVA